MNGSQHISAFYQSYTSRRKQKRRGNIPKNSNKREPVVLADDRTRKQLRYWLLFARRELERDAGGSWRSERMAAAGLLFHAGICRMWLFHVGIASDQEEDDGEREAAVERRERLEVPRRKMRRDGRRRKFAALGLAGHVCVPEEKRGGKRFSKTRSLCENQELHQPPLISEKLAKYPLASPTNNF